MKRFVDQNLRWVLIFLLILQVNSLWPFSSNNDKTAASKGQNSENMMFTREVVAEFSMEPFNNQRGMKLVENARNKMLVAAPSSCWQRAYQSLFSGCSQTLADEESRNRFAWHLTECFLKHSGRQSLPHCDSKSPVEKCLKAVDQDSVKVYLEYHLETNSICHQLQIQAFKQQTERLVNELKRTAEYAEMKLENIEAQGEQVLRTTKEVHDSLGLVDTRTQELQQATKKVENHVNRVFNYSKELYEQSKEIAASQMELSQGQVKMKENLEEGMRVLHDSYNNLGDEINLLRDETVEIEMEISRVGDAMFSKMSTLQNRTDDVRDTVESSIDKQKELLAGQSMALNGLRILTEFQSKALEESRGTLQQLAEFGQKQQQELLQRQEQLQQAHDHLVENSKTILAAQEAFESKQAKMFVALDKLFAIHNAMLLESRLMKAFLVYSLAIFLIYMFTSTKQTYNVRPRIYMGLCMTFLTELAILRFTSNSIERQGWMINLVRSLFLLLGSSQLLYSVYTYRDYDVLNHQMLLTLMEKVTGMHKGEDMSWNTDSDSEVEWSKWIDKDLPEDIDRLQDPDYLCKEEVGENSVETNSFTKRYNLRNRHR